MLRVVMNVLLSPWTWVLNRRLDELEARLLDVHARVYARSRR